MPIIANSHKIMDRLTLVDQLKQHLPGGMSFFVPTKPALEFLLAAKTETIALALPPLQLPKVKLSEYAGPQGEEVCKYGFDLERVDGQPLSQEQRQWLIARYLVKLEGCDVFVNTVLVQEELAQLQQQKATRKPSLSDEQMLDVAEVCFVRIAEILSKHGITVREVFQKYAVTEMLPESKTVLELIVPAAFLEAIRNDLGLRELSDLEAACMLRVLSKPELGNAIVLNEFALIMENFGVPLLETTLSDDPPLAEEEYTPDGAEQPRTYNLANIDADGTGILQAVARYLLKEYLHPREFFGKMIKPNQEVKTEKKTYRLDLLSQKDFYLKVKIANIRKVLTENQSLNTELCLDPATHPTVFNMKTFVRALEDIAEIEQEKIFEEQKEAELTQKSLEKKVSGSQLPPRQESPNKSADSAATDYDSAAQSAKAPEVKPEV